MKNINFYRIKVQGSLRESWSEWFNGMSIAQEINSDGTPVTILIGPVVDQTALHGLLDKIRDLGLKLVSVERVEDEGSWAAR
jgi:hypothetical protein